MSFVEKVEQLNQEIGATFDRAFSALRQELRDRLRDSHQDLERGLDAFSPQLARPFVVHEDLAPLADRLRAQARGAAFEELRDAFIGMDRARTQSDVLTALLAGAGRVTSRAAVLLVRGGELRGWGGHGFADSEKALHDMVLAPAGDSSWGRLAHLAEDEPGASAAGGADRGDSGTGGMARQEATSAEAGAAGPSAAARPVRLSAAECAVLCGPIESRVPAFGYLVPLVLRDRVVAALYADQSPDAAAAGGQADGGQADGLALPALQLLVYVAALAIESLPFRQRAATATLAPTSPTSPTSPVASAADAGAGVAVEEEPAPAAESGAKGEPAAEEAGEPAAGDERASAAAAAQAPAEIQELPKSAVAEPQAEAASAASPETEHGGATSEAQAHAAAETPVAESAPAALAGDETHPGLQAAGAPYAVTPATLYDAPRAPAVKETAEIQLHRPLRPLPTLPPLPEGPDVGSPSAGTRQDARQEGGQPSSQAPAETPAAASPDSGGGGLDTQLLPHAALRDAGTSPWGRKSADQAQAAPHDSVQPAPGALAGGAQDQAASTAAIPASALRAVPPAASPAGGMSPSRSSSSAASGATTAATPPLPASPSPPWSSPPLSTSPAVPAAPAFEPARTPIGTGTPEVRPPSGVQGPGWAFSTSRVQATSGEQALHEEARRLARLLVSEIKLYNEEQVEAGRRNCDIYERLREDIDRSRQMYEERVDPRLVKSTDYFYQELVRILGAGDAKTLGI
jgi:hypothetical protein